MHKFLKPFAMIAAGFAVQQTHAAHLPQDQPVEAEPQAVTNMQAIPSLAAGNLPAVTNSGEAFVLKRAQSGELLATHSSHSSHGSHRSHQSGY
ncbi:His-Xaa-Ser repeat protein HxsA2 [Derxia gummosa]|uniref:His-Xaa-Ser repeat protein HxsA2 n=1 Tax=Derxia gummosa DSM 723 TaxID=1121388 RepID=A0A8B6XC90_9BURK|nr:His-Xaa-Ser repeat protein HxsA2 [Derxia gummosa]